MKLKFLPVFCLVILIIGISSVNVQAQNLSLNITKVDLTERNIQLSLLKKITFVGSDMVLNYQAGNAENVSISLIQRIMFSPFTALSNAYEDNNALVVYPNPSSDFVILKNLSESSKDVVVVYSINGIKIMEIPLSDKKIDISHLIKGIYLIRVNNQVSKFTKL
ncbi:MAG: T9SS type A sorting domain-containing protein [Paludibacter sp.]|nr:T9SS type A sorting domain-containing protein [Paludibacter sp.]